MKRIIHAILLANLLVIVILAFVFPHLMVSPGDLIAGHRQIAKTACFACHIAFGGASSAKCLTCHKVAEIGVLTTNGTPIVAKKTRVPFHQKLLEQDCVACHSDHMGVAKYRKNRQFSHKLLDASVQRQCASCHRPPADRFHGQVTDLCEQCHTAGTWKAAQFKHERLPAFNRGRCASCHKAKVPTDTLHRQVGDKCGQCHNTKTWKPTSFDHGRWFRFDRHHPEKCTDCHVDNVYNRYTCYGCHEHSAARIRSKHLKEGIRDFENCAKCHRSGDEDEAKRRMHGKNEGWSSEGDRFRGERHSSEREHDD